MSDLIERLGRKWMEEPPKFPVRYDDAARWWCAAIAEELEADARANDWDEGFWHAIRWLRSQVGEP